MMFLKNEVHRKNNEFNSLFIYQNNNDSIHNHISFKNSSNTRKTHRILITLLKINMNEFRILYPNNNSSV